MIEQWIGQAIDLAADNVRKGGGPFGALIVQNGIVIARGANQVTRRNDPTAHAEVEAIREACRALGSFQLTGCELFTSCEPCPMCLGAIYWARLGHVYFAATRQDATRAGFDDSFIYDQIPLPVAARSIPMTHLAPAHATRPFEDWAQHSGRTGY